jgi:sodium/proline symporter
MKLTEVTIFFAYFAILLGIGVLTSRKQKTDTDFILGNRSLNFWLTALSAHASDMSSWLFLAYPALIFTGGLSKAWAGIGLTIGMFLNWQYIAPKIRTITEQTNSLTLSAYFENRVADKSGNIRIVSAIASLLFYTIYISSGLIGLGLLVDSLFGLDYLVGISIGLFIVMLYVFMGGYKTVAWIDLFQGFFLLGVIIFIPFYLLTKTGGMGPVLDVAKAQNLSTSLFPDYSPKTLFGIILLMAGWGLGYFGQPHIITKFMGIRNVKDIVKSKVLGISWQILALGSATLIGIIGIYYFPSGLANPELLILNLVKTTLLPIFAGLVLCAILAATTNVMAAQILVVASSLAEDFYKRLIKRTASSQELLWASRISVVLVSMIAFIIAFLKISTIYELVLYAWSGLGASFGPLLIISLYSKSITRQGALSGVLVGALVGASWPYFSTHLHIDIPAMVVGFVLSALAIYIVSFVTRNKLAYDLES